MCVCGCACGRAGGRAGGRISYSTCMQVRKDVISSHASGKRNTFQKGVRGQGGARMEKYEIARFQCMESTAHVHIMYY